MIRTGHIVAAFIAIVIAALIRWQDPTLQQTNPFPVALWMMLIGGAFWEACLRIWGIWYPRLTGRVPSKY